MKLVEIATANGNIHINPANIVLMRERKRMQIEHTGQCRGAGGGEPSADCSAAHENGKTGCTSTPMAPVVEILLLNTVGAESSIFSTDTYERVRRFVDDALKA